MTRTIDWLLDSPEPWTRLAALRLSAAATDEVRSAEAALMADRRVAGLLEELDPWPPVTKARGALLPGESFWKLSVLADFGVPVADARVVRLADQLETAQAADGTFRHGGFAHTGAYDERGYTCVTHVVTYALARFGRAGSPAVARAVDAIAVGRRLDGGWRPSGPTGAKAGEPSCPYGTLTIIRALAAVRDAGESLPANVLDDAREAVLEAWRRRSEPYRPVGFGIGAQFMRLAYPFWSYSLLKMADALAAAGVREDDERWRDIRQALVAKTDSSGRYFAESVSRPWAGYDFGQKREPSSWITFLATSSIS